MFDSIAIVLNSKPTFTVVTAVFNGDKFIRETVESVLRFAPAGDFEYILIDDGSTDETPRILKDFGAKIKLVSQSNSGEAHAVNRGILNSKGTYGLVVSADDPLFSSELFRLSREILDNNPEIMATYPDWYLIDECSEIQREIQTEEFSIETLVGLNKCIPGPGAIFRLEEAKIIGGRNVNFRYGSDFDFWLRLSVLGIFQRIPFPLAQWRSHQNSTSIKHRGLEMSRERIMIIEDFLATSKLEKGIRRKARGNAFYSAAILRYFSKDVPHRRYLLRAFFARRGFPENAKIHELIYLLSTPVSEFLWGKIRKSFKGMEHPHA